MKRTCVKCSEEARALLVFTGFKKGRPVSVRVWLCEKHGERMAKRLSGELPAHAFQERRI
jgi:hypothetical protein